MFATSTALLVSGLVGAGAAAGSAVIGSKAAKNASKDQIAAAEKAQAETNRQRERLYQDFQPYYNVGVGAAGKIGEIVNGINTGGGGRALQMPAPAGAPQPIADRVGVRRGPAIGTPGSPSNIPMTSRTGAVSDLVNRHGTVGAGGLVPSVAGGAATAAVPIAQRVGAMAGAGTMVTLMAPDGSTRQFSEAEAEDVIRRTGGAVRRVA